jgi:hypothetical protein
MRRLKRLIAASVLVAFSGALAGCSSGMSSWDPMDYLDWLDTKKKVQGDRKPVFPDGVSRRRHLQIPSRKRPPRRASSLRRQRPARIPRRRLKKTIRLRHRQRPRRKSFVSAPPRRRPIRTGSNPARRRRNPRPRPNNPARHSPHRYPAAHLRAKTLMWAYSGERPLI